MPESPNLLEGNLSFSDRGSPESRSDDSLSPFRKRQYCYQCEAVHCLTEQKKDVIRSAIDHVVDQNYEEDNPKLLRYKVYRIIHDEFLDDGEDSLKDTERPSVPDCARAFVQTLIGDNYLRPALARHMWLARINKEEYEEEQRNLAAAKDNQEVVPAAPVDATKAAPATAKTQSTDASISNPKSELIVAPMHSLCCRKVKSAGRSVRKVSEGAKEQENRINRQFLIEGNVDSPPKGVTVRIHSGKPPAQNKKKAHPKPKKKEALPKKKEALPKKKDVKNKPSVVGNKKKTTKKKSSTVVTAECVAVASRSSSRVVKRKKWEESSSDDSEWEQNLRAKTRKAALEFKEAVLKAGTNSDSDHSLEK